MDLLCPNPSGSAPLFCHRVRVCRELYPEWTSGPGPMQPKAFPWTVRVSNHANVVPVSPSADLGGPPRCVEWFFLHLVFLGFS